MNRHQRREAARRLREIQKSPDFARMIKKWQDEKREKMDNAHAALVTLLSRFGIVCANDYYWFYGTKPPRPIVMSKGKYEELAMHIASQLPR